MNKKTMNKLKLSLITIATLTTANVNAQTFYQCVREACPSGQYFDGVNCKSLPTQSNCPPHFIFDNGKCYREKCDISFNALISSGGTTIKSDKGLTVAQCKKINTTTIVYNCNATDLSYGDCFTYVNAATTSNPSAPPTQKCCAEEL